MGHADTIYTSEFLRLQRDVVTSVQELAIIWKELQTFGCELKDPATGLIDFLSLRDGQEVYLWLETR